MIPVQLSVLANQTDSSLVPGLLAAAAVAAAIVASRQRRLMFLGLGMFLLFVVPSFVAPNSLLLECRLYLPLAGVLILGGAWLQSLDLAKTTLIPVSMVFVAIFGVWEVVYAADYRSPVSVGEACLRTAPSLGLSHMTAGNAWESTGDSARAEAEFRRAIEIDPTNGTAHNNLGVLALRRGDRDLAQRELRAGLALNPGYDKAHFNLGLVLRSQGRRAEAAAEFARAAELNPDSIEAFGELMATYMQLGDAERAREVQAHLVRLGVRFVDPVPVPPQ